MVFGVYHHDEIKTDMDTSWKNDFDYPLKPNANNFAFFYNGENDHAHFESSSTHMGYIYTDYTGSGAISFFDEWMLISWAEDFEHRIGNSGSLINVDEGSKWKNTTSFKPQLHSIEVWQY